MEYKSLIKRIEVPSNFHAPSELTYDDMSAKPLTRNDLHADMEAVNSSLELIRKTRGGSWPAEPVTEEFDVLDLAWHEREFRDGGSFVYAVYSHSEEYIGCFYLYGMGLRTPLTEERMVYQVDASWWVTTKAYSSGYYQKLQSGLRQWLADDFGFTNVYYSNKEQ